MVNFDGRLSTRQFGVNRQSNRAGFGKISRFCVELFVFVA